MIHGTDVHCGHAMLQVIVNLMNFAGATEPMRNESACTAARDVQDSDESREWSAEDDNVWGNVFVKMFLEFAADSIACVRVCKAVCACVGCLYS